MKRNLFVAILVISMLMTSLVSVSAVVTNLVPNGDIENTDISAWIPVGSTPVRDTTEHHGGTASLKASARSAWYFAPQIHVNLVKDVTYTVTAWVKNSGTEARNYNLYFAIPKSENAEDDLVTGNADYLPIMADVEVVSGDWVKISADYVAPKTSLCNFYVLMTTQVTEDFYMDDISIMEKIIVTSTIPNGGFEDTNINAWIPVGSTPVRDTTQFHTGTASLKATDRAAWYFAPQIHINLVKDTTYQVTAWVRNSGTESRNYNLYFAIPKSDNAEEDLVTGNADYLPIMADVAVASGEWVELSTKYTAPKTSMCNFYVLMTTQVTEDFYMDDISVVETTPDSESSSMVSSNVSSSASSSTSDNESPETSDSVSIIVVVLMIAGMIIVISNKKLIRNN